MILIHVMTEDKGECSYRHKLEMYIHIVVPLEICEINRCNGEMDLNGLLDVIDMSS